VQKSAVSYHFGDKARLMSLLLESLIHDWYEAMIEERDAEITIQSRLRSLLSQQRQAAKTRDYWKLVFELMPEVGRDTRMRRHLSELGRSYYETDLRHLGLWRDQWEDDDTRKEMELIASLLLAVVEGFALQRELFPDDYDMDARFELWERVITPFIEQVTSALPPEDASGTGVDPSRS
jgi:AcrR family transcriptional regulator